MQEVIKKMKNKSACKISNLRKNKLLFFIGAIPIVYGIYSEKMILTGVSMVLWAVFFVDIFGAFFVWIALAGVAVVVVGIGDPLLLLLTAVVLFVVIVFDNISFVLYFIHNPKERKLLFTRDENAKRQLVARLKDRELFYLVYCRIRKIGM